MLNRATKLINLQDQVIAKAKEVIAKQQEKIVELERQVAELQERLAEYEPEEPVEEVESERTVSDIIFTNHLDSLCRISGVENHLADMYHLPISAITADDLDVIEITKELLAIGFAGVEWEEGDADDYYNDIYRELMCDINCLIYEVRESLGFPNEE